MPPLSGRRMLKRWRYVGVYGEQAMLCAGIARVGPARQSFWALWDRGAGRLHERTTLGRPEVVLARGSLRIDARDVQAEVGFAEGGGIEVVCPHGGGWVWTCKQAGARARGWARAGGGATIAIDSRVVVDDTAGYHDRHTAWSWSAGAGEARDGRAVAWNLVAGVNDPPSASERTVWIDGEPQEARECVFAPDLSAVGLAGGGELRFAAEAVRERRERRLVISSCYRQPFGTFSGALPGAGELARGYGVMERHVASW